MFAQLQPICRARRAQPRPECVYRRRRIQSSAVGYGGNVRCTIRDTLDAERRGRLEGLPGWVWSTQRTDWEEGFSHLLRFVERDGHAGVPGEHLEDGYRLGGWVTAQRRLLQFGHGRHSEERRRRLEALPGWVWSTKQTHWGEGFSQLLRFVEREGHARVPRGHREDGYRLGSWVGLQRAAYQEGKLDPQRRARLEGLPGWTWDPFTAAWEEGFAHLRKFVEREGHPGVPASHRDHDGFALGRWVSKQRQARNEGRLDQARAGRLEALRGWTWDTREAAWEKGYGRLQEFAEREGHARVPQGYRDLDGFGVGRWASGQRLAWKRGRLDQGRVRRLEALPGWVWDAREAAWEEAFTRLQRFVAREGHARVPGKWREDGYPLGNWVSSQKASFARRELEGIRRERLEGLPGWLWRIHEAAWEEGFVHLEHFVAREAHARVPVQWREDGFRLGPWVVEQRTRFKDGQLDPERRVRLEGLPGWSWGTSYGSNWEEGFVHLQRYVAREGHGRVAASYKDDEGFSLGAWVQHQRTIRRRGRLSDERARRLESVPGWDWDTHETAWEDGYARLLEFVAREGHAQVTHRYRDDDGFKLGNWVHNQRTRGRRGELSDERARRLESVPGWTWGSRQRSRAR